MLFNFVLLSLQIVEIEQPFDKVKNQRRAFIFITYESEEIVEQVIATPKQTVGGREVSIFC
jgi:squid